MIFDEDYQGALLARTCNKDFMYECGDLLSAEMFEDFEDLAEDILNRWNKNKKVLSAIQFKQLVKKYKAKVPRAGGDIKFDEEQVLAFAQSQTLKRSMDKAHVLHANGKIDKALETMVQCQMELPQLNGIADNDILKSDRVMPKRKNIISTGLPNLDKLMEGGVAAGDLAVVIAPTSGGKTSLLSWFAVQAALAGKKVYYTTLEVPDYEIEMKMRRCVTGEKNPSKTTWAKLAKTISKKKGHLWVTEHPPHTIGPTGLDAEVPSDADLIVVDYADYLRPPGGNNSGMEYHDLGHIYTGLKRIAMTRGIPIWTASQVNRSAYDVDELRTENVESSLKKMMICDQAIGFQQETTDEQTGTTICNLYIAKNRHGARFISTKVTAEFGLCRFIEGERF